MISSCPCPDAGTANIGELREVEENVIRFQHHTPDIIVTVIRYACLNGTLDTKTKIHLKNRNTYSLEI